MSAAAGTRRVAPPGARSARPEPSATACARVVVALLAAALLAGCGEADAEARARSGPHVLLVVVDTLRADHLAQYGHDRATDAGLAALARDATRFERAYAPSPWTTPSTATILTGLHPLRHGSTHHGSALGQDVASLAELLADGGWQTAGFSFNHNVSAASRFDQGFGHFEDFAGRSTAYPDAGEMVDSVRRWLDDEHRGRAFLYLQPMNAHGPYAVPEEARDDLLGRAPVGGFTYYGRRMRAIMKKGEVERRDEVSPGMLESLAEQYDTAVRYSLDRLGELLDDLRARGLYDDTLVIVTADHGEELFDHGGFSHGYSLHDEVLHVPLLVKLPGQREAAVVDEPVSLADIYPTVADVLGVPVPYAVDGRSLRPLIEATSDADDDVPRDDAPGQLYHVDWEKRCVAEAYRLGRWKLIRVERDYAGAEHELRLYDVHADPEERRDLAASAPRVVAELTARMDEELARLRATRRADPEVVLDELDEETLRALGYL